MLTSLPTSLSLPGPSTQRIHALQSKTPLHATGDHIVFKYQKMDQEPLRSDIYIRHASPVTSTGTRASLQPTPRPSPRLPPPRSPAWPTGRREPSGGSDVRLQRLFSHPPTCCCPGALPCLPELGPAQHQSGRRLKEACAPFFQIPAFNAENRTFSSPRETGSFKIQLSL